MVTRREVSGSFFQTSSQREARWELPGELRSSEGLACQQQFPAVALAI